MADVEMSDAPTGAKRADNQQEKTASDGKKKFEVKKVNMRSRKHGALQMLTCYSGTPSLSGHGT